VLAVLFSLVGIAWVVFMMTVVSPSEKDVGILFVIASIGTVPIVIGIMIYLSDIFDKMRA
jgi:hypothetical protein